jgi:hypothetical protein
VAASGETNDELFIDTAIWATVGTLREMPAMAKQRAQHWYWMEGRMKGWCARTRTNGNTRWMASRLDWLVSLS